jgi:hypothetical protein
MIPSLLKIFWACAGVKKKEAGGQKKKCPEGVRMHLGREIHGKGKIF